MFSFFVAIHVLICAALIIVVLLQSGRGGGLAGAFGGGGAAQTLFGGRGAATFLTKATAWLAISFMVMSILLAVLSTRGTSGTSDEGLLQRRARSVGGQVSLPPSSSRLDASTALDSLQGLLPPAGETQFAPADTSGAAPSGGSPP